MDKHLHIISFNVPYPADYGGVIDVFYRIKALSKAGVKIHLHCFQYGREVAPVLNDFCEEVIYYKRSMSALNQFSAKPFIVKSRANRQLLQRLQKDEYPILFEGLHTCNFLGHPKLAGRKKIVRCHNIEHDYYNSLAAKTPWLFRQYFRLEASKLKRFEELYHQADFLAAISASDYNYFEAKYGKTILMPPCHPNERVNSKEGRGSFILYHGNLSVQENDEAAKFVVEKIAPFVDFPFVIAGKNPSKALVEMATKCANVEILRNPDDEKLDQLVIDAHINLLPTFQATGFKLKLLNALYNGRFCVGTPQLTEGTGLGELCVLAASEEEMIVAIKRLLSDSFSAEMVEKRRSALEGKFSNRSIISKLIDIL
ncbi:MAG TPA: glycosyltransferase [Prolixibacteraceae bacterium]|nr:glycosyltransferase [Prolixibacteraceae bacterium]HPS12136.1 glycosyltransferase [Prolixibacteraceae bacterium]